jgi:hypothetical protein
VQDNWPCEAASARCGEDRAGILPAEWFGEGSLGVSRIGLLALQLLVAVVGVAAWQLLATVPILGRIVLPPFFFSNPVDVGSQIVAWFASGIYW